MALFWDVKKEKLDPEKHKDFIIARTLEHGHLKDVQELLKTYNQQEIKKAVQESRNLSEKTAWFWSAYFNIPKNQIKCLNKSYLTMRERFWPY